MLGERLNVKMVNPIVFSSQLASGFVYIAPRPALKFIFDQYILLMLCQNFRDTYIERKKGYKKVFYRLV